MLEWIEEEEISSMKNLEILKTHTAVHAKKSLREINLCIHKAK